MSELKLTKEDLGQIEVYVRIRDGEIVDRMVEFHVRDDKRVWPRTMVLCKPCSRTAKEEDFARECDQLATTLSALAQIGYDTAKKEVQSSITSMFIADHSCTVYPKQYPPKEQNSD